MQDSVEMGMRGGQLGFPGVMLTREVRWFFDGRLPDHVLQWFTGHADFGVERRIDRYDLASARRGVGVKQRGTTSLDSKFRVLRVHEVAIAPGVPGHVEDWIKISEPLDEHAANRLQDPVEVHKELFTRSYLLPGAEGVGCEAELAWVIAGQVSAWTICFETFGPPAARDDASG
jgi:hypothetical protein